MADEQPFLTAQWRHLAMVNFEIEAGVLRPFIPVGTQLDCWQGRAFVTVIGFQFLDTRVWRRPIPYHRNVEEVNLRFYVRCHADDGWCRAVVFVKEVAIAITGPWLYGEN
jgi:uncharacterized protein YqjF (DUF2071 family)